MRKKPKLAPLVPPPQADDNNRWLGLGLVSRMMTKPIYYSSMSSVTAIKKLAFRLSKAWSVNEPLPIPPLEHSDELDAFLDKTSLLGDGVSGDLAKPMQFHYPLLTKYAFSCEDNVDDRLAWTTFKQKLRSLGPTAWCEWQQEVARIATIDPPKAEDGMYPFPVFLDRVSRRLEQACFRDTLIINRLYDLAMRGKGEEGGLDASMLYHEVSVERRQNVMEMNRCISVMALFYYLCKEALQMVERWTGLDAVIAFFENKLGDGNALKRYCCVLDVDAVTSRSVIWDLEDKPIHMDYEMDDSDVFQHPPEETEKEEEEVWWKWVENVINDLNQCGLNEYADLDIFLIRIDKNGSSVPLHDWHCDDSYCE